MGGLHWQGQWDPFREIRREVGRLLGNIETIGVRLPRPFPAINLYDAGDRFVLAAELPGVSVREIELSIAGETLTLRGERTRPEGVSEDRYRRQERAFGRWSRSITLPERVDGTGVVASFSLGILTVTLPKDAEARPRQIAVSTPS
ncbi:Hsp20/alpha crystallin family protein [Tautonia plasticadhaerens]|uniref:Spore protein SP21 n=1 Tax=Tautonia plasticadhaerens TaxID=2527974 RepID=A0A518GWJ3_9BACT|nr:Hsp20/alpha crystallin family protein [Tautonia plasticadhaerens]QDV32966.1 Spore protein SP21 [Tautonia plasticadhaerens]